MSIVHHVLWALINSVWQGAALAALVYVALRCVRRTTAAQRYAIWGAVLIACTLLPALDLVLSESWIAVRAAGPVLNLNVPLANKPTALSDDRHSVETGGSLSPMFVQSPRAVPAADAHARSSSALRLEHAPKLLVPESETPQVDSQPTPLMQFIIGLLGGRYDLVILALWFLVANLLIARLALGYHRLRAVKGGLRYRSLTHSEHEIFSAMTSRAVAVGYSSAIAEPCVIGFIRPVIALPDELPGKLSTEDIARVLRHECAHVSRFDDYGNFFKQTLMALLFFSPAVMYISRALDVDREIACDDAVALAEAERILFAKCLYEIARSYAGRRWIPATGLIRSKRQIAVRIRQLLDSHHSGSTHVSSLAKIAALVIIACALPVALVQVAASDAPSKARAAVSAVEAVAAAQAATAKAVATQTARAQAIATQTIASQGVVKARTAAVASNRAALAAMAAAQAAKSVQATLRVRLTLKDSERLRDAAKAEVHVKEVSSHLDETTMQHVMAGVKSMMVDENHVVEAMAPHALADIAPVEHVSATRALALMAVAVRASVHAPAQSDERDAFLQALSETGFANLSVDDLIAIRNAGVSPEFLHQLHDHGLTPMPAAELVVLSNNGVDATFLAGMTRANGALSVKDIISLRNSGVTPSFCSSMSNLGYHLSVDEIESLANAGVDQHYVAALLAAGIPKPSTDDIIHLHNNGVSAHYLAALSQVGYGSLKTDDVIRLSNSGVTAGFIARVRKSAINNAQQLSVDDLIKLYDAGI